MVLLWCKMHACRLIYLPFLGWRTQKRKAKMVPLVEYSELCIAFLPQPLLKHTVSKHTESQKRQCLHKDLCETI